MDERRGSAALSGAQAGLPSHIASQGSTGPNPQRTPTGLPPHVALPLIQPESDASSSSLLEAVVGPGSGTESEPSAAYTQPASLSRQDVPSSSGSGITQAQAREEETDEGEREVLSDAGARLNRPQQGKEDGESDEIVKELQEKVAKRRSQLPQLESQLAELEAQIKAAEERLAHVQSKEAVP